MQILISERYCLAPFSWYGSHRLLLFRQWCDLTSTYNFGHVAVQRWLNWQLQSPRSLWLLYERESFFSLTVILATCFHSFHYLLFQSFLIFFSLHSSMDFDPITSHTVERQSSLWSVTALLLLFPWMGALRSMFLLPKRQKKLHWLPQKRGRKYNPPARVGRINTTLSSPFLKFFPRVWILRRIWDYGTKAFEQSVNTPVDKIY